MTQQQRPSRQPYGHATEPPPSPSPNKQVQPLWLAVGVAAGLIVVASALGGGDRGAPVDADGERAAARQGPEERARPEPTPTPGPVAAPVRAVADGEFGNGRHVVGRDVAPGTYESTGAVDGADGGCVVTTAPAGGGAPQRATTSADETGTDTGGADGRVLITLEDDDGTVLSVRGCAPFTAR
ncbi:hypothetical protein [Streptomyces sp. NPDC054784]